MIFSNFFKKYRSNNNVKTEGFFSDWNDLDDDADQKKNRKHVIFLPEGLTEAVSGKLHDPLTDAALRRALAEARVMQRAN